MKDEKIRHDIIQAQQFFNLDQSVVIFEKAKSLNKIITKPMALILFQVIKEHLVY